MDIVVWLRSLGLGKYEAAFRENEIDETVLPSLTEEHLKQLGALPRRRLLPGQSGAGNARCRFHGGKSTGPKTQAGRARIAEAQRLRWLAYRERVRAVRSGDETGSER